MEQITFKRKGLLYQLYTMTFKGIYLPEDTCSYRFRLITSLLLSCALYPLTMFRILYRIVVYAITKEEDAFVNGVAGFGMTFFVWMFPTVIGIVVSQDYYIFGMDLQIMDASLLKLFLLYLVGVCITLLFVIMIAVIVGAAWLIYKLISISFGSIPEIIGEEKNPSTQFGHLYWSFKEKYCKRINWK